MESTVGTKAAWLTGDEQQHWRALVTAITLITRRLNGEMLASHNLSLDDYAILAILSEAADDRLRFGELAQILRVPKAHVTYRVRRLIGQGFVERQVCPSDARGAFATLTAAGRAQIESAAPSHVATVRSLVLDHMTENQLETVGDAMRAIVDADASDAPDRY